MVRLSACSAVRPVEIFGQACQSGSDDVRAPRTARGTRALGTPILRLQRRSVDAQGRVFEYSDDRYLSDIVRFTVGASGRQANGEHLMQPESSSSS